MHLVVEEMATTGEEAWLALRRAARMSRAHWAETLGTVACEIQDRWGRIVEYVRTNGDIKAVCEQEGIEERGVQDEWWNENWKIARKIAGSRPLTNLNVVSHQ